MAHYNVSKFSLRLSVLTISTKVSQIWKKVWKTGCWKEDSENFLELDKMTVMRQYEVSTFPLMCSFLSSQQAWLSTRGRQCTTSSCAGGPSTSTGMFRATIRQRTWRRRALAIPRWPQGRFGCLWPPLGRTVPYTPPSWGSIHGPASVWPPSAPAWCPETTSARTVTQERSSFV